MLRWPSWKSEVWSIGINHRSGRIRSGFKMMDWQFSITRQNFDPVVKSRIGSVSWWGEVRTPQCEADAQLILHNRGWFAQDRKEASGCYYFCQSSHRQTRELSHPSTGQQARDPQTREISPPPLHHRVRYFEKKRKRSCETSPPSPHDY